MALARMPLESARLDSSERIYKALKDFELIAIQPPVEANAIFMGNANDMVLPSGSNEYVVNTVLSHIEHGTPFIHYGEVEEDGTYCARVSKLIELIIQVDCYSDDQETARFRAESLATITRTPLAVDFMARYNLSSLYAEPPQNATIVGDADKYVQRWTTTLHLSYTHVLTLNADYFDAVKVGGVFNVDSRFPPE